MDNSALAHKKRVQAGLSVAGSTLGLAALGTKGGAVALRRLAPKGAHAASNAASRARRLDNASLGLVTTASGVGGASGFNFASIQRQEAKNQMKTKVVKSAYDDAEKRRFHAKVEGAARQAELRRAAAADEAAQARQPRRSTPAKPKPVKTLKVKPLPRSGGINPERRRQNRLKAYESGLALGSAAAAGASAAGFARNPQRPVRLEFPRAAKRVQMRGLRQEARGYAREANAIEAQSAARKTYLGNLRPAGFVAGQENKRIGAELERAKAMRVKGNQYHRDAEEIGRGLKGVRRLKVAAPRATKLAAVSGALGLAAVGTHSYRHRGGKPYSGWWDR